MSQRGLCWNNSLKLVALQQEPELHNQQLLEGQPPPRFLRLLFTLRLMPAPQCLYSAIFQHQPMIYRGVSMVCTSTEQ